MSFEAKRPTDCIGAARFVSRYIFEIGVIKEHIKSLANFKNKSSKTKSAIMKENVSHDVLVRGGNFNNNIYSTVYVHDMTRVPRGQVDLAEMRKQCSVQSIESIITSRFSKYSYLQQFNRLKSSEEVGQEISLQPKSVG